MACASLLVFARLRLTARDLLFVQRAPELQYAGAGDAIATLYPHEDLLAVDGIGPAKADRFGDGWLSVLREGVGAR